MSAYTSKESFETGFETLHATFKTGKTKDVRWRKWQLKQLFWMLEENEDAIVDALKEDLNRTSFLTVLADVNGLKEEIVYNINEVDNWAKGEAPQGAGFLMGYLGGAWLRKEPLGVCLVIGAWNFPLFTVLGPAICAIAAGNCCYLKPSESSAAAQDLLVSLIPKYMDNSAIRVVTGGPAEMANILTHKFNHICYTGGATVGRIIATAAAKHLTPVILELGGQAPVIVTKTANLDLAAKRIITTKLINSGQICLNANHVFVDPSVHDALVKKMTEFLTTRLADGTSDLVNIINTKHYNRIQGLLQRSSATQAHTGPHDEKRRFIYPTILTDVQMSDSVMSEEIFGPLLPVLKADVETALKTINSLPLPLGLYIFSGDQTEINHILDSTNSGGVTINDLMLHPSVHGAPFGGVGESGYGSYHGKFGFDAFSHTRTVVGLPDWLDSFQAWRYGPEKIENRKYTDVKPTFKRGETLQDQRPPARFLGLW